MGQGQLPDGFAFRVKAAVRDLIERCGGNDRAAALTKHSRSVVHRWGSANDADMINLTAAMLLERDAGAPLLTEYLAEVQGRCLVEVVNGQAAGSFELAFTQFCAANADLIHCIVEAVEDGGRSLRERMAIDKEIGDAIEKLNDLRKANAAGERP